MIANMIKANDEDAKLKRKAILKRMQMIWKSPAAIRLQNLINQIAPGNQGA